MSGRKLASIQIIENLEPIEGADKIETASVLGWKVVVMKGEFQIGEKACYIEIDSLLPPREEFKFLEKSKYRIKTIRLRGQLSQGICFPLSILPPGEYEIGQDITKILGVKKYEQPLPRWSTGGTTKRNFPGYVPKTDEPRVQSNPEILDELRGVECYRTIKIDGTSSTFCNLDGETDICSRTRSIKDSEESIYWKMSRKYNIVEILEKAGNFAIQGEIAGWWQEGRSAIQGNPLGLVETELFVFDVYDIKNGKYLDFDDFISFCAKNKLQTVPVESESFILDHSVEDLLEMAKGAYPNGKQREGIVIRPKKEIISQVLKGRASFKAINNDYLLKGKK